MVVLRVLARNDERGTGWRRCWAYLRAFRANSRCGARFGGFRPFFALRSRERAILRLRARVCAVSRTIRARFAHVALGTCVSVRKFRCCPCVVDRWPSVHYWDTIRSSTGIAGSFSGAPFGRPGSVWVARVDDHSAGDSVRLAFWSAAAALISSEGQRGRVFFCDRVEVNFLTSYGPKFHSLRLAWISSIIRSV